MASSWIHGAWALFGVVVALASFEIAVQQFVSLPASATEPEDGLERYFYYGYSIEEKLRRLVGRPGEVPAGLITAGWVKDNLASPSERWDTADERIAIYGMSFTDRIADQLERLKPNAAVIRRSGPAAPLSHSFVLFEEDPWRSEATHVVVGILSSSVPYLQAVSGLGFSPESPAPYVFPRFVAEGTALRRIEPPITDSRAFIDALRGQSPHWTNHLRALEAQDGYWDSFVIRRSFTDQSALLRLVRRAWAARNVDILDAAVRSSDGQFLPDHPSLRPVPLMLEQMQRACASSNQRLVILMLHSKGDTDQLDVWLRPVLEAKGIAFVSSSDLFSSADSMNFLPDAHYTQELDRELAGAVQRAMSDSQQADRN